VLGNRFTPYLYFGGDRALLAAAERLDGKPVVLTGEMRRALGGSISGLDEQRPPVVLFIHVQTLQPATDAGAELQRMQG
jgi:hypothetical protein